jgi:hypothetical protein
MIRVNHARRSCKQDSRQNILRSDELLSFQTSKKAIFFNFEANWKNVIINIPNDTM